MTVSHTISYEQMQSLCVYPIPLECGAKHFQQIVGPLFYVALLSSENPNIMETGKKSVQNKKSQAKCIMSSKSGLKTFFPKFNILVHSFVDCYVHF